MTESQKEKQPFTHTAWIMKTDVIRKGRRIGRWIDEGVARVNEDGSTDVYLHSLPIGGFDGRIHLAPLGASPPDAMLTPQRPGNEVGGDAEDDDAV